MSTLWLYLHFPTLQLNAGFVQQQKQEGDTVLDMPALIIVDKRSNRVCQLDQQAKLQGIKVGMGLGSAAALCQQLQVNAYDIEIEKKKLTEIAQWLYLVSADICPIEPNGLLLRVSNMLTLYGGLENYWQTIEQHLKSMTVDYQYACAYSPYAATLLAKDGLNQVSDDANWLLLQINKRPLTVSELPNKTIDNLKRIGVNQFQQLLKLPLTEIAKRFDIDLVNYVGRLSGQLQHTVNFYHPPEQFNQHLDLLYEISNLDWLQSPLTKLLIRLERFLYLRDKRAGQIEIQLHFREQPIQTLAIVSAQMEYRAPIWLELSQLTLASLTLAEPIIAISLAASKVVDNDYDKADLFSGKRGAVSAKQLVSRLQAKLGSEQVRGINVVNDHRPEYASHNCQPFSISKEISVNANTNSVNNKVVQPNRENNNLLRPSLMLPEPEPLVESVSIEHGPERIVSGWWDNNYICRDYFVARSQNGRWLWIFKTPEREWFLHGVFS
ncbi:Y-family DNA polymerase [Thalassotalea crassostreae]|uniref:Y-family DNA polymerase n=1 Tax=Thalassotalea crassostreae TaxID=1763536 RepID=UPI000837E1B1|nr:DNA polymerase Y family protein [Thalassotalea crassostreae]